MIAAFFLFGLIFGSFLNVCIYRMPLDLSVGYAAFGLPGMRRADRRL